MPSLTFGPAHPAQIGRGGVPRAVVEAGAVGGVLGRVGLERGDGVGEAAGVDVVAVAEQAHGAGLPQQLVVVLAARAGRRRYSQMRKSVAQLVRILRRRDAADAQRPVVPVELGRAAPRIAARVGREIPRRVGHERHVEERLARIAGDRVLVEEVEDREVAERQHEAAAVDDGAELHRVGLFVDAAAAEVERLPQERARRDRAAASRSRSFAARSSGWRRRCRAAPTAAARR